MWKVIFPEICAGFIGKQEQCQHFSLRSECCSSSGRSLPPPWSRIILVTPVGTSGCTEDRRTQWEQHKPFDQGAYCGREGLWVCKTRWSHLQSGVHVLCASISEVPSRRINMCMLEKTQINRWSGCYLISIAGSSVRSRIIFPNQVCKSPILRKDCLFPKTVGIKGIG